MEFASLAMGIKGRFFFFSLHLVFSLHAFSQEQCTYTLQGRILDIVTREPIPFVTIQVSNEAIGTVTDENGYFEIHHLCLHEFDFIISHVGYKTAIHHHDTYHETPTILLASDNQVLESIVVEGEYNPTNLHTMDLELLSHRDFAAARTGSLGDLASSLSGVSVLTTGQNIVKPIIHGLHSNRVLIINNGVRHEFQNWGGEHAPEIDPSLAASLEVVKGAATVRYGPDALGGVILIHPPTLELSSGFKADIGLTGKSNGRSAEGSVRLQYGWKNLVLSGQTSAIRQGDLHSPEYQLTNTGKVESSYAGAFRYHKGNFEMDGYYSGFYQNLGILRGSVNGNLDDLQRAIESAIPPGTKPFSYAINNPRQEVMHHLMKIKGAYLLDDQDFSFQYAYQKNHRKEFNVRRAPYNQIPSIDLELSSHSMDVDWNHPSLGQLQGTFGIQGIYQDNNNLNPLSFVPNFNNTRIGLYTIERIEHNKILFEAGLRYDYQYSSVRGRELNSDIYRNELSYNQLTGSVGIKKQITENLNFRSNLGMAWRPPNISELYSFGKHQASIEYGLWRFRLDEFNNPVATEVLNHALKPAHSETGFKWINSWEWQVKKDQWEITAYANLIRNYIYAKPAGITKTIEGAFPFFIYDQDDALFSGMDMVWKRPLLQHLQAEAKGSYVWARNFSKDDVFTGIPPARLDFLVSYDRKPDFLSTSTLSLGVSKVFRYFQQPRIITIPEIMNAAANNAHLFAEDDSNFDFMKAPDGYFLMDISWSASSGPWEWIFQVKNIFDRRYRVYTDRLRFFADQTGRNIQLSIQYSIR